MVQAFIVISLLLVIFWLIRERDIIHFSPSFDIKTWLLIAGQSLVVSVQIGVWVRDLLVSRPQEYSDFITGNISFQNVAKSFEYSLAYITLACFVLLLVLFAKAYEMIEHHPGEIKQPIYQLALYSLIPAAILVGLSLRLTSTSVLLLISFFIIVSFLMVLFILNWLLNTKPFSPQGVFNTGSKLLLIFTFVFLSEWGLFVLLSRMRISFISFGLFTGFWLVFAIASLLILGKQEQCLNFDKWLNSIFVLSQLGIPLLFFSLASPPVILRDGSESSLPYRFTLQLFILGLVGISYIDIFFRERRKQRQGLLPTLSVSPLVLAAVLVYYHTPQVAWPAISLDEYHSGEWYLPWWLFKNYTYLPFIDYQPARGLANYLPGMLSWLFFDNTFSGQTVISSIHTALYVLFAFFSLRLAAGSLLAFLAITSVFPFVGLLSGGILISVASLAVVYAAGKRFPPLLVFGLWAVLTTSATLFMVAEGGVLFVATLPLGLYLLYQAFIQSRKSVLITLAVFFVFLLFLTAATQLEQIGLSLLRYLSEQSAVNDLAHGIPWGIPANPQDSVTSGYLWQVLRFSWLLLLIPLSILLVSKNRETLDPDENLSKYLYVALFIMVILMIPRAAGRIDQISFSRPGLATNAFFASSIPLLIAARLKGKQSTATAVLSFALIAGIFGNHESNLVNSVSLPARVLSEPSHTVSRESTRIKNIGLSVVMDAGQVERQIAVRKVLSTLLNPGETYYDATNRQADYGFQGRPSPVTYTAPYNMPAMSQQIRTIEELEKNNVPLVYLKPNVLHDGGTLALRNFWVYRYLLENFIPFRDGNEHIWMVRKGEEYRLEGTDYQMENGVDGLDLLNTGFWQKDLIGVPAAWGNSLHTLDNNLDHPVDLFNQSRVGKSESVIVEMESLEQLDLVIDGTDPFIYFNLPQGVKGDILFIEFDRIINAGQFQVFWTSDLVSEFSQEHSLVFKSGSTHYLIPVSSAPSWALSSTINQLRLDIPEGYQGELGIKQVILYDRCAERCKQ